jgi:predicted nucleotide-binding protein (sugar kinase/HSP70/actin superfamily)
MKLEKTNHLDFNGLSQQYSEKLKAISSGVATVEDLKRELNKAECALSNLKSNALKIAEQMQPYLIKDDGNHGQPA